VQYAQVTVWKFITALTGAIGIAISEGLIPESVNAYVTVAVAFLAALGVYVVPYSTGPKRDEKGRFTKVEEGHGDLSLVVVVLLVLILLVVLLRLVGVV
jgi:hypothetical protein